MKTYPSTKKMKSMISVNKRSVMRSTMNSLIKGKKLRGKVLDVGSNYNEFPSYYKYFNCKEISKKILLDSYKHKNLDVVGDAQQLPFSNSEFDTLICFNLIEHVPSPSKVVSEASRVLKKNGKAFFYAPYLTALHSEQKDYMGDFSRLSHASWKHLISQYFSKYKIYPVSFGPLIQSYVLFEQFIPRFLRIRLSQIFLSIDDFLVRNKPYLKGKYLLAVYVEATK